MARALQYPETMNNNRAPLLVDLHGNPLRSERPSARVRHTPISEVRPAVRLDPPVRLDALTPTLPAPAPPVAAPAPAKPLAALRPAPAPVSPSQPPLRAPGVRVATTAVVYVRGRRVAWSRTPDWSPLAEATGREYDRARLDGLAGVRKSGAYQVVQMLLSEPGVDAVLVHSADSDRIVHVSKPADGGSIRAAWSDTPVWMPSDDGRSVAARAARAEGLAGVAVGVQGLVRALRGL